MSIAEGIYDAPANPGTWARLSAYGKVDGLIAGTGDKDWYRVFLEGARTYTITMVDRDNPQIGNDFPYDSAVSLYSAAGKLVATGTEDGSPAPDDSQLVVTPAFSGYYFVQAAGSIYASGKGSYTLELLANGNSTDIPETRLTTQQLPMNTPLTSAIDVPTDVDLIKVDLSAGVDYAIRSTSAVNKLGLALYDPNGNLEQTLSSDQAFNVGAGGTHYLAVYSNEESATGDYTLQLSKAAALVSIEGTTSATQSAGSENSGTLTFTIRLSKPTATSVSVEVHSLTDGTATAGADYEEVNRIVAFASGETSKQITVKLLDDKVGEPAEAFILQLSNPNGAAIGSGRGYAYIFDDEYKYGSTTLTGADPLSIYQWYLYPGSGINVFSAWTSATGDGIKVAVYDQGIDSTNPELTANIRPDLGRIASTMKLGGDPIYPDDNHGTAVAGVIAAVQNGYGIVGAAYNADLVSIYQSFGNMPGEDALASKLNAFNFATQFDVLNDSWGYAPKSVWQTFDYPWAFYDNFRTLAFYSQGQALKNLVETGRNGLGTIVVQSAGNSFSLGDDTNLHNYQNSRYIITVAATDYLGDVTDYSSPGASVLVAAPGGGGDGWLSDIFTTDRMGSDGYSGSDLATVNGTSFSAPLVSAIVALMLDANDQLGYRDVQQILAYSAKLTSAQYNTWTYNGAHDWNGGGLHFDAVSHDLGFGLVDATAAVRLAETWGRSPATSANDVELSSTLHVPTGIPDGSVQGISQKITETRAITVERVEVTVDILHTYVGDLGLLLTSPSGTQSTLLYRAGVNEISPFGQDQDQIDFTFTTVLSMGESSLGDWKLNVYDLVTQDAGELQSWTLNLIGKPITADNTYIYTNEFSESLAADGSRSTLVDTSGIDTLNAAAATAASTINLTPGATSTIDGAPLVTSPDTLIERAIGGDGADVITGNRANNELFGMRGNDTLRGAEGNDTLTGGQGDDRLEGGVGLDMADYAAPKSSYQWSKTSTGWTVRDRSSASTDGTDTLVGVERLHFADTRVALDLDGSAGSVVKVIGALFGKQNVATKEYVAIGLELMDAGMDYTTLVTVAVNSVAFGQIVGTRSNTDFVKAVYKNVVGITPPPDDLAYFKDLLDSGVFTQYSLAMLACETDPNKANVDLVGLATTGVDYGV